MRDICSYVEKLECIRETDTTERFFVFGGKTSVRVAKTYSLLDYHKCKVFLLDRYSIFNLQKCTKSKLCLKIYYNTVLL